MSGVQRWSRPGSSRCDFVGVEPRFGGISPCPPTADRRPSQMVGANLELQAMIDEFTWSAKESKCFDVENLPPSLLLSSSNELQKYVDVGGPGEQQMITVLLPWMQASVRCGMGISLGELKQELFARLTRMWSPSSRASSAPADYVFRANCESTNEVEELYDETLPLCRLELTQPFPFLMLHEPEGVSTERELAASIGQAIGLSLGEVENRLTEELKEYRLKMYEVTVSAVDSRGAGGLSHHAFPEEKSIEGKGGCPEYLNTKITSAALHYQIFYRTRIDEERNEDGNALSVTVDFSADLRPRGLVERALQILGNRIDKEEKADSFILQLVGRKSYLTTDNLLINYGSVRAALENYRIPQFVLRRQLTVLRDYPKPRAIHKPAYVRARDSAVAVPSSGDEWIKLWDIDDMFKMRPVTCSSISSAASAQIYVQMAVFVGEKVCLCQKSSGRVSMQNPRWLEDFISFPFYMKDIPSTAILCLALVEERQAKKGKGTEEKLLGWVNMRLVDWRGELVQGQITLNLWPAERGSDGKIDGRWANPRGELGMSERKGTPRVVIELPVFGGRVRLPNDEQFAEFVESQLKWGQIERKPKEDFKSTDNAVIELKTLLRRHGLGAVLTEDEDKLVWDMRYFASRHLPDALVMLAENREVWKGREKYAELFVLLRTRWGKLSKGAAIDILGRSGTDGRVRAFAVRQLDEQLDKHSISLYLLPLLQALKCEWWAESALAELLLKRALSEYRVGHKLFWLLRALLSEQCDECGGSLSPGVLRTALLIEAYLRGNEEHVRTVLKQVEMVDRLTRLSVVIKGYKEKDAATRRLREELREQCAYLENIDSPLDPTSTLGDLCIDECRVLGSAKMPLRLQWRNMNPLASEYLPTYGIIFKNGDDLRQDMLVLQVLEVMDALWKRAQMECCLSPYPVLPMGTKIGMIGVVSNCATIFEIQSEGGKMGTAVKSLETTFINKYIRQHTTASKDYLECVDRFMMSCVGYSVATFIMGIKDRHNDNIMMTADGKLFHIDFGHILGHGKTKLGIQRDRVPFVLTEHFLCVIGKGKPVSKDSHEVIKFKRFCISAYLQLWEERSLFVSLFTVMRSMKLPELSTDADLEYLKRTLCVSDDDRTRAERFFSDTFEEAFAGSWSTKTNWFFHTVKHL